ncbi:hypothetical protein [Paenibacillus sp. L3-i20]|uniref:hypothetical protein n=1 Tax=Paenibacillus sp. L3-i20 TaxID=2905833 RepID=UPI001EE14A18|nr:hypothetical protein [Paenibacillus sp. L3-i20]GKU79499.1 hypothetical protein L3i20_v238960 [Paenibacillus sp. L3-i20]
MKKPRFIPIVITTVLSIGLLFGGWTFYKQVVVASPLTEAIMKVPGVVDTEKPSILDNTVHLSVELSQQANLSDLFEKASEAGNDIAPGKKLDLQVQSPQDEQLNALWQKSMFEIAEAMETKMYSKIPDALKRATTDVKGVSFVTDMDETNVYITIRNDKAAKYMVLPRTPTKLGAWSNA